MNDIIAHRPQEKLTVLVVEDDSIVRELVCEVLADNGLDTVSLGTVDEGALYLEHHADRIGLAVLDVRTPGELNGIDLARIAVHKWPTLPLVLTSGYTGTGASLPSQVAFIPKPWTIGAFLAVVNRVLAAR